MQDLLFDGTAARHIGYWSHDNRTMCSTGEAVRCAEVLAKVSLYPVSVVRGGYQKFSALYPFFKSVKIMYTIMVGSSVTSTRMNTFDGH